MVGGIVPYGIGNSIRDIFNLRAILKREKSVSTTPTLFSHIKETAKKQQSNKTI